MTAFTWLITAISLVGVVLNIRQDRRCFYLWIMTNSVWTVIDWSNGLYAQAVLFAVYFVLSVWGAYRWQKQQSTN